METERIKKYLSLAAASRSAVSGTDAVLDAVRHKKDIAVVIASDASDRTKKQLCDKCAFYGVVPHITQLTTETLAGCIGKKSLVAAVAVTNKNLAGQINDICKTE